MTATGAVYDTDGTDLLTITEEQYAALQPLVFHIGNTIFALSPNAQIWPRASNADLGGVASKIYLAVANVGLRLRNNTGISNSIADRFILGWWP
jgi:hypothetical protein